MKRKGKRAVCPERLKSAESSLATTVVAAAAWAEPLLCISAYNFGPNQLSCCPVSYAGPNDESDVLMSTRTPTCRLDRTLFHQLSLDAYTWSQNVTVILCFIVLQF